MSKLKSLVIVSVMAMGMLVSIPKANAGPIMVPPPPPPDSAYCVYVTVNGVGMWVCPWD